VRIDVDVDLVGNVDVRPAAELSLPHLFLWRNEPMDKRFRTRGRLMERVAIASAVLALTACNQAADKNVGSNTARPANAPVNETTPPIPPPETGPDARTPLAEPQGAIDPKSVEAAGQVVQHYGALTEQKRWAEANKLWSDGAGAAKFATELAQFAEVHLEIGNPGDAEGAAGSIYVTIPVIFYGERKDGQPFRRSADVILRRVNDVPGSTEEQRRWHVERIEWAGPN
jgi:hypothetical protein